MTRLKEEQNHVLAEKRDSAREIDCKRQDETAREMEEQERGKSGKGSGGKETE